MLSLERKVESAPAFKPFVTSNNVKKLLQKIFRQNLFEILNMSHILIRYFLLRNAFGTFLVVAQTQGHTQDIREITIYSIIMTCQEKKN